MGLPFLLYLGHALPLAGWVVDDAGITFAYSRSLAHGHGLVAQPGAPPVEGYSNFTWLVLMAPFFWVGAFDPVVTPKIVSAILVLATFVLVRRTLGVLSAHPDLGAAFVCTLLAANTGFVVWTTSGLENPLYVLLTVLLLERLVATQGTRAASNKTLAALGALCGLIAMTRPDGMVFFAAVPILLAIDVLRGGRRLPDALWAGAAHALGTSVIFGGFLLFRRAYFDAWLPNTYYAKGGPTLGALAPPRLIAKVDHFLDSLVPFGEWGLFVLALALLVVWARRTRLAPAGTALIVHAALAASVFVLLPLDWMTEYRFASVAYPPLYALLFVAAESALRALPLASAPRRALAGAAIAGFLVWSTTGYRAAHRSVRATPHGPDGRDHNPVRRSLRRFRYSDRRAARLGAATGRGWDALLRRAARLRSRQAHRPRDRAHPGARPARILRLRLRTRASHVHPYARRVGIPRAARRRSAFPARLRADRRSRGSLGA